MTYQTDDDDGFDDVDDPEDEGYIPCPHCGEMMLEAADYCPACDRWITSADMTEKKRHPWWIVAIILVLLATFLMSALPF